MSGLIVYIVRENALELALIAEEQVADGNSFAVPCDLLSVGGVTEDSRIDAPVQSDVIITKL